MSQSPTPRQSDCLAIQRQLPGWKAKFISLSLNYVAYSPDYNEHTGTGVAVIRKTPKEVVEAVRLLYVLGEPTKVIEGARLTHAPPSLGGAGASALHVTSLPSGIESAILLGFTGDTCTQCHGIHVRNNGTCKLCADCGTTTGCS